ncbi:MAG: modification methylase [Deltaproteobacteria bacterium SG8_13]|nr:MAG: modification methylase [Deltaproteobacteria bacterium SG8_13]
MKTDHRFYFGDARDMRTVADESIELVVTSPPYPMIQMWDDLFTRLNPDIGNAIDSGDGWRAFELMHAELTPVWREAFRILVPGGIACINTGDAVRTVGKEFRLFPNHAKVLAFLTDIGFSALPMIIWRKPTNAPNKFMGSGMLPPAAYITLEHECILVVRKGGNRRIEGGDEKKRRRESAYFWEERNTWFSDVWTDVKGAVQNLPGERTGRRSAAFPFEVPYRLINMFSVKGDRVVDPFLGTGTCMLAAAAAGRNAVGFELEPGFQEVIIANLQSTAAVANRRIRQRLTAHMTFVKDKTATGHRFKHTNRHYGFAVMTGQETDLLLNEVLTGQQTGDNEFSVSYRSDLPSSFT